MRFGASQHAVNIRVTRGQHLDLPRTPAHGEGDPTKWNKTATQVGEIFWSPKKKVAVVTNSNQKTDTDLKAVDLWSKSLTRARDRSKTTRPISA